MRTFEVKNIKGKNYLLHNSNKIIILSNDLEIDKILFTLNNYYDYFVNNYCEVKVYPFQGNLILERFFPHKSLKRFKLKNHILTLDKCIISEKN